MLELTAQPPVTLWAGPATSWVSWSLGRLIRAEGPPGSKHFRGCWASRASQAAAYGPAQAAEAAQQPYALAPGLKGAAVQGPCWARELNGWQPIQLQQRLCPGRPGWRGLCRVHFPGTQVRRLKPTHSRGNNGLDSCLLEVSSRLCTARTLREWTGLCQLHVDDSDLAAGRSCLNCAAGSSRFLGDPDKPPAPGLGSTTVNAELGLHFPKRLRRISSAHSTRGSDAGGLQWNLEFV